MATEKCHKFSLGYFLAALVLLLVVQFVFVLQTTQISYAQFKKSVAEDKVAQVLISDTLIRGMLKPETLEKGEPKTFTVVPVNDPNLVQELQAYGVDFRGQYEILLSRCCCPGFSHLGWLSPFGSLPCVVWAPVVGS